MSRRTKMTLNKMKQLSVILKKLLLDSLDGIVIYFDHSPFFKKPLSHRTGFNFVKVFAYPAYRMGWNVWENEMKRTFFFCQCLLFLIAFQFNKTHSCPIFTDAIDVERETRIHSVSQSIDTQSIITIIY